MGETNTTGEDSDAIVAVSPIVRCPLLARQQIYARVKSTAKVRLGLALTRRGQRKVRGFVVQPLQNGKP